MDDGHGLLSWPTGPVPVLETPRLRLRSLEPADAPTFHAALCANRPRLEASLDFQVRLDTLAETAAWIDAARARFAEAANLVYAVTSRDGGTLLGNAALSPGPVRGVALVSYWLDAAHTGRGLATEAAAALTRVAFEVGKLRACEIHCGPDNPRSHRVAHRLGYKHEATLRSRLWIGPRLVDQLIFTLHAVDFSASRAAACPVDWTRGASLATPQDAAHP